MRRLTRQRCDFPIVFGIGPPLSRSVFHRPSSGASAKRGGQRLLRISRCCPRRGVEFRYTAVQGDVSTLSDLDRLYDAVRKKNRKIDVIFANAGIAQLAPFGSVDEEFFDRHFDANVKGLFFTVQKGLPLMNDGGAIILTASIATIKAFPSITVYSATKAAVRSFARTWTNELRDRQIRVNAISPGHIDTPIFEGWQKGDALTKLKEDLANTVPLGRMGDPDEIAKAVSFLASDEASYISGIELFVDGGVAQI